jgi:hypothetical protein
LGVIRESSVPSLGEPQASAHRAMLPSVDTSLQGGASIKKKTRKNQMTIGLMMVIVYLLGVIFFLKELFTRGHHFVGFTMGIEIHWIWHENMWFCYLWNRSPNYLYNYR